MLVATQTVEVGANLDVDGLVTESAPWDSLVQRLGRLNRVGECPGATRAVVVHDGVAEDPVYGAPRQVTWDFLCGRLQAADAELDVSPLACRALLPDVPPDAFAARLDPPLVTTTILDAWARTAPVPVPDPPGAPYLHGLGRDFAAVAVAWRDGLVEGGPTGDDAERPDDEVDADLSAVPVLAAELVEVPIHAVRRWLAGETPPAVSDLDEDAGPQPPGRAVRDAIRAVAWRSTLTGGSADDRRSSAPSGSWTWIEATGVRAGDVIVVPTQRGGLDDFGWAPNGEAAVLDVAELVRFQPQSGQLSGAEYNVRGGPRRVLRLDGLTGRRLGLDPDDTRELHRLVRRLESPHDEEEADRNDVVSALVDSLDRRLVTAEDAPLDDRLAGTAWTPAALRELRAWMDGSVAMLDLVEDRQGGRDHFLLSSASGAAAATDRDDEGPECSSMGSGQVALAAHHANVGDRARDIATALELPADLVSAVEAAARWHDLGKIEARFQTMLCGGDQYAAMLVDEPLAKSGMNPADRAAYRTARLRSGLPPGTRHEAWSAAMVGEYVAGNTVGLPFDADLVIHLVASHHGHARPWLPPVRDDDPTDLSALVDGSAVGLADAKVTVRTAATVDFEHPERFARLNCRYGR